MESANELARRRSVLSTVDEVLRFRDKLLFSMRPIRTKGEARRNCGQRGGAAGAVTQDLGGLAGLTNAATRFHHGRRAAAASHRL